MKKAFITGITGQDGSYLAELLLSKGYEVHGMKRRASSFNTSRIDHLYQDIHENSNFKLHYGDLSDSSNLIRLVHDIEPDEIYNLAAQSHVKVSWDCPEYTADCDALGTLRLLEAIRMNHFEKKTKFYQASTSDMFAANGILFNHESPRRGETFVTRKITMAATKIKVGLQEKLYLGNLSAKRDWGHAKDYVEGMWRILQQDKPQDYVLATGVTTSIRDFCKMTFEELGIDLEFVGEGVDEKGIDKATGKVLIEVDPRYFRPAEVDLLLGNSAKARRELGWEPKYDLKMLVKEMVAEDLELAKKEKVLKEKGYKVLIPQEV